jgi:hypothetical protein
VKTLVVYLMSGPETPELAAAAVAGGADLVELGFPFSDPLADGPVIRRAAERALGQGMRTRACLECLARTRELVPETPLVPMTYSALLEAYGWDRFAHDAVAAGATSLIVADLPAGERPELRAPARRPDVDRRTIAHRGRAHGWLAVPRHRDPNTGRARRLAPPAGERDGAHRRPLYTVRDLFSRNRRTPPPTGRWHRRRPRPSRWRRKGRTRCSGPSARCG